MAKEVIVIVAMVMVVVIATWMVVTAPFVIMKLRMLAAGSRT
jgi:hypothetical protein